MFLLFLTGSVGLQVWAWHRLIGRVQAGALTRLQGVARYVCWAFLPVLLFVAGFLAMVGLEEWLRLALIEERAALLALPVLGLSVLGSAAFAVRSALVRSARPPQEK